MLDHTQPTGVPTKDLPAWLITAQSQAHERAVDQWQRLSTAVSPWLWMVPDIGASAQVLLADRLFGDLRADERDGLHRFIRDQQHDNGTWSTCDGQSDLSLTVLGWWACIVAGDDPESMALRSAQRAILQMGGAQRASFEVRIWLALAGTIPWSWLPAIPSELWLLPANLPLSAITISGWAGEVVTPYHLMYSAPVRLHLPDATSLLVRDAEHQAIPPRLTRPGLAGDMLQAFDRVIKASRKLPRHMLRSRSRIQAQAHLLARQQRAGGWFSTIPTLFSLLALRGLGHTSDADCIRQGLQALRASRGRVALTKTPDTKIPDTHAMAQAIHGIPWAASLRLALAHGDATTRRLMLDDLVRGCADESGPWQAKANAPCGGWPLDRLSSRHLDVLTTAQIIETIHRFVAPEDRSFELNKALRRAATAMLAMQELDGSFARFERGEDRVIFAYLPWSDAEHLRIHAPGDAARAKTTAWVLRALGQLGWERRDDRIERAVDWLEKYTETHGLAMDLTTLIDVVPALAFYCSKDSSARRSAQARLRASQREDGSFGAASITAQALSAILDLSLHDPGAACVQATRAGRWLARWLDREVTSATAPTCTGLGLCPTQDDISADLRETLLALQRLGDLLRLTAARQTG